MPLGVTTRDIKRSAMQAIHHPPKPSDKVKVSHNFQKEKAKMVRELIPFLTYLYKKHLNAKISEDMAVLQFEDIKIPISVGDTVLGGKFKNKRIVVKSIGKNEKGDITINGRPLLKYRTLDESTLNEFGGTLFHLVGFDSNNKPVQKIIKRASDSFMKDVAKYGSEKLFKSGKNVEYVKIYYDKTHLATVKDSGRKIVKEKGWGKLPINENPMGDLQKIGVTDFKSLFKKMPSDLQKRVYNLKNFGQRLDKHPEGNVLKHTITVVNRSIKDDDIDIAIAAMFHDIGKDETAGIHPKKGHITHFGHEKVSANLVNKYKKWIESVGGDVDSIHYIVRKDREYNELSDMRPEYQPILQSHP